MPPPSTGTCSGRTCAIPPRILRRAPGFAVTAIADRRARRRRQHCGVLRRPTSCCSGRCRSPSRIASSRSGSEHPATHRLELSPPNIQRLEGGQRARSSASAFTDMLAPTSSGSGEPHPPRGRADQRSPVPTLGVEPLLGRLFASRRRRRARAAHGILSHRPLAGCFGGEARILGRTILLDNEPFTVIGVMPRDSFPATEARSSGRRSGSPTETYDDRSEQLAARGRPASVPG